MKRLNLQRNFFVLTRFCIIITLLSTLILPSVQAQSVLDLPAPGNRIPLSNPFSPLMMKGINIHHDNPFTFDFIMSEGEMDFEEAAFKKESTKLVKYFLAALTVPEDQMWVNLSPYEKDRIIPDIFGSTEMGRDLLAQDYMLKQLMASLMYPEDGLGRVFWDKVYAKAYEQFKTTEIPMNTFHKIWIVPEEALIYEHLKGALIVRSHLKVLLESDYLALKNNRNTTKHGLGIVETENIEKFNDVSSKIIKDILIPAMEQEVNQGKTFANLRQMYHSMLLASWYKDKLKEATGDFVPLRDHYMNQGKTAGIDMQDKNINRKIYNQYVEAFQEGVFDYITEEYDDKMNAVVPRKYFSGGVHLKKDYSMLSAYKAAAAIASVLGRILTVKVVDKNQEKQASPPAPAGKKRPLNLTTRKLIGTQLSQEDKERVLSAARKNARALHQEEVAQLGAKLVLGKRAQTAEFSETFPLFDEIFPLFRELLNDFNKLEAITEQTKKIYEGEKNAFSSFGILDKVNQISVYEVKDLKIPAISSEDADGTLSIYIRPGHAVGLFQQAFQSFFRFPYTTTVLLETAFADGLVTQEAQRQIQKMSKEELEIFLKDYGNVRSNIIKVKYAPIVGDKKEEIKNYALEHAKALHDRARLRFEALGENLRQIDDFLNLGLAPKALLGEEGIFFESDVAKVEVLPWGEYRLHSGKFSAERELIAFIEAAVRTNLSGPLGDVKTIKEIYQKFLHNKKISGILNVRPKRGLIKASDTSIKLGLRDEINIYPSGRITTIYNYNEKNIHPMDLDKLMGQLEAIAEIETDKRFQSIWKQNKEMRRKLLEQFDATPEGMPLTTEGTIQINIKDGYNAHQYSIHPNGDIYDDLILKEVGKDDSGLPFAALLNRIVSEPNPWIELYPELKPIWPQAKRQREYMRAVGVEKAEDLPHLREDDSNIIVFYYRDPKKSIYLSSIIDVNISQGIIRERDNLTPGSIDEKKLDEINAIFKDAVEKNDPELFIQWSTAVSRRKALWEGTGRDPALKPVFQHGMFAVDLDYETKIYLHEEGTVDLNKVSETQIEMIGVILQNAQPFVEEAKKMIAYYNAMLVYKKKLMRFHIKSINDLPHLDGLGLTIPLTGKKILFSSRGGVMKINNKPVNYQALPSEYYEQIDRALAKELEFNGTDRDENIIPAYVFRKAVMHSLRSLSLGVKDITRPPSLYQFINGDQEGEIFLEIPYGEHSRAVIQQNGNITGFWKPDTKPETMIKIIEQGLKEGKRFPNFDYNLAIGIWHVAKNNFRLFLKNGFRYYHELPSVPEGNEPFRDNDIVLRVPGIVGESGIENKIALNKKGQKLVYQNDPYSPLPIPVLVAQDLTIEEVNQTDAIMKRADNVNPGLLKIWIAIRPKRAASHLHLVTDATQSRAEIFVPGRALISTTYHDILPLDEPEIDLDEAYRSYVIDREKASWIHSENLEKVENVGFLTGTDDYPMAAQGIDDNAMAIKNNEMPAPHNKTGGIDLNPAHTEMKIATEGQGFIFPKFNPLDQNITIESLTPLIIHITPSANILKMIGLPPHNHP